MHCKACISPVRIFGTHRTLVDRGVLAGVSSAAAFNNFCPQVSRKTRGGTSEKVEARVSSGP